jgi:hypothetical protein
MVIEEHTSTADNHKARRVFVHICVRRKITSGRRSRQMSTLGRVHSGRRWVLQDSVAGWRRNSMLRCDINTDGGNLPMCTHVGETIL